MTCNDYTILLHRDLDGRIAAEDKKLLTTHLEACPRCTTEQASLEAMRGALLELRHVEVRPGLAEQIVERATAPRAPIFRIPRLALVPIAASILALCLLSGALGYHFHEPGSVQAAGDKRAAEEPAFRRFLSNDLALSEDKVDLVLKVRHDFNQKLDAAAAEAKDQKDKLEKAELDEMWKVLPDDARKRYLAHDPTFVPPEKEARPR